MEIQELHKKAAENSKNYRVYEEMGELYENKGNWKRAYLCYAHSLFLCQDEEAKTRLSNLITGLEENQDDKIPLAALLIPSVPDLAQMKAILKNCIKGKEDIQTIVVIDDDESKDVSHWLLTQENIQIVYGKGSSPALALKEAIRKTKPQEDLMFLGKGAVPLSHALFQLRMSLYKDDSIGAAGAVTNGPAHGLTEFQTPIDRANVYADEHNLPGDEHMSPVLIPSSCSLLVRRDSFDKTKGFYEKYFTMEVLEKDLCFQLLLLKKQTYLCHHAYVYTFVQTNSNQARWTDFNTFHDKWNVRLNYSLFARPEILNLIADPKDTEFRVLDVGCACGASLLAIKHRFPKSEPHGIELDPGSCKISSCLFPVTQGNVETNLDYEEGYFDYIIFGDVLEHLHEPQDVLINMKRYLKPNGAILASIPNVMHISVIHNLLNGLWTYEESGILDKTHLRFFTKTEITRMFSRAGYEIEEMGNTRAYLTPDHQKTLEKLNSIVPNPVELTAYQYLIRARKQ
ncbi:methyltransferase domain-containing protein [Clostridium sp. E02]|uniref:methyltransferase domain-containing protein n=1 Tax=Clostridium sp. E02 TaxID=2487134 RepID=UPI000F54700F|nr:methyltransferase domain-containing protein [Clostridium sp. E02]